MYILEVEENEAKVEKMKQEGKDEYTIKKAVSCVDGIWGTGEQVFH